MYLRITVKKIPVDNKSAIGMVDVYYYQYNTTSYQIRISTILWFHRHGLWSKVYFRWNVYQHFLLSAWYLCFGINLLLVDNNLSNNHWAITFPKYHRNFISFRWGMFPVIIFEWTFYHDQLLYRLSIADFSLFDLLFHKYFKIW